MHYRIKQKGKGSEIVDGLIIKKEWLNLILDGVKRWEIRSTGTKKRGRIALIESGSGLVKGDAYLSDSVIIKTTSDGYSPSPFIKMFEFHRVKNPIYKINYAWTLVSCFRYPKPIPYTHPQGAVIWVKNVL